MVRHNFELLPSADGFRRLLELRLASVGLEWDTVSSFVDDATEVTARRLSLLAADQKLTNPLTGAIQLNAAHFSTQCLFLYELSRQAYRAGARHAADCLYSLNVALSSCDLYYEVELPLSTGCEHPLGSVIGRARFGERSRLFFYNACVIGGSYSDEGGVVYPNVEGTLIMYPNSSLVGRAVVQGIVILGHGVRLVNPGVLVDSVISLDVALHRSRGIEPKDRVNHARFRTWLGAPST